MIIQNNLQKFAGKKILITGHTGFKGSWLALWLSELGGVVTGLALDPVTEPSHYSAANVARRCCDHRIDIRDAAAVRSVVRSVEPDFVFHLAAQALVGMSYKDPLLTWSTNLIGTLNVIEALRELDHPCSAVLITSDKVYENNEWVWGYRESDTLGGNDPYSASKAATELAIRSQLRSFFSGPRSQVKIAVARAGNVIGGGDWSEGRIIPDCIRAWEQRSLLTLRNPNSTRPWQHVLEPLGGYLLLAQALNENALLHGEAFNFGPRNDQIKRVIDLINQMRNLGLSIEYEIPSSAKHAFHEAGLLSLNCEKAAHYLGWNPILDFDATVELTVDWYRTHYSHAELAEETSLLQIKRYMDLFQISAR
jgi:CDP-glucose 4,6-dehydratase